MSDILYTPVTIWFPDDTYGKDDIETEAINFSDKYPYCIVQVDPAINQKPYDEIIKENDNG